MITFSSMRFGRSNRNLERFLCLLMHIFFIIWPDNVRKTLTRYYLNNWHENLLLNFSRVSIERASYIRIAKISQRILEDASLYRSKAALILPMITLKSMMYEKHKKYSNGVNCISIIILKPMFQAFIRRFILSDAESKFYQIIILKNIPIGKFIEK